MSLVKVGAPKLVAFLWLLALRWGRSGLGGGEGGEGGRGEGEEGRGPRNWWGSFYVPFKPPKRGTNSKKMTSHPCWSLRPVWFTATTHLRRGGGLF